MTPRAQRIGILVIGFVMVIGTLGSFVMLILANNNAATQQDRLTKEYQEMLEKQQKEVAEQTKELSDTYYSTFKEYENRPAAFDAESVGDTVTTVDLKVGDGEAITKDATNYRAYYIGWNPKGVVFDGSIDGDSLKLPLDLTQGRLIEGWYAGVDGMKIGGVREITIPSDLAYAETGRGDDIPPNTPIKFVIMIIPAAEA
jgi:FKBP-type peptidyl-prolyl cis-trans isomerase